MFRIKTDIRQYKCESREKVERLIRNWVVRPTDLIFDREDEEWRPIGEHAVFASTFAEMANQESEEADTVVSPHPPAAMEEELEDDAVSDDGQAREGANGAEVAPVEQSSEPADGSEEGAEAQEPVVEVDPEAAGTDDGTVEESTQVQSRDDVSGTPEPSEAAAGGDEAERDGAEDVAAERSRDRIVDDEENDGETDAPAARSNDGIGETDADESGPESEGASDVGPPESDTSDTSDTERFEDTEPRVELEGDTPGRDRQADFEDTAPSAERPAELDRAESTQQDGATGAVAAAHEPVTGSTSGKMEAIDSGTRPAVEASSPPQADTEEASAEQTEDSETPSGRHDLPEDIFATNEIAGSVKRENVETIDELGGGETTEEQLEEVQPDSGDDYDYREVEDALQRESQQHRAHREDEEWDEIMERLRETDELSKQELDEITETRDEINIGRDQAGDDEDVPEEVEEYVSEGYEKELPIRIGPTRKDIEVGLERSDASRETKDRVFPYPEPKREDEVVQHFYRLKPPKDHSLKVILSVFGVVLALIVTAVFLF